MRDYSGNGITRNKLTRNNLGTTRNQPLMDMVVSGMSACSLLSGGDGGNPHQKPQHHAMTDKGDIGSKRLLKRRSRSPDDFYAPVSSNNDSDCDMYSLIGPGALQSFSDSTQCDISSLEFSDIGQPGPLPLNCVWGNGMQYQPNINISNTANQYPSATHSQATVSVPLISTTPSFNPHLPFPDKSGNMTLFSYGMQGSMMSPPPPTLNASLGYPTVYVSPAGLITVLLKYDVAIEMTVDKNIRVVNHRHKAVAASNNRGSANCVYHVAAKIYQEGTKVEAEVFGDRRARMQTDGILFAASTEVYLLDDKHIVPSHFIFNNMSKDSSVNILFGASGQNFTNDVLIQCDAITKSSKYYFHKDGSTTIIINGVKIHQDAQGEVSVKAGPRIISTSPVFGNIYLQTHFVEISVQVNWNVSIQRGSHKMNSTYTNFVVCNGVHEAGFNQFREVFSRDYNPTVSEFENWLPSLTYLSQGLPQSKKLQPQALSSSSAPYTKQHIRDNGGGDHTSTAAAADIAPY